MFINTYDPKKRKNVSVGEYDNINKTFKKVCLPEHYMIKYRGYGIQLDVIESLRHMGCLYIQLICKTIIYTTPFMLWETLKPNDSGHGNQVFLEISSEIKEKYGQPIKKNKKEVQYDFFFSKQI